jgi:hypothetical protein
MTPHPLSPNTPSRSAAAAFSATATICASRRYTSQ